LLGNGAEPKANSFFTNIVADGSFSIRSSVRVLGLCDPYHQHHLVVSPNEVAMKLLGLRIERATTSIKILWRLPIFRFSLALEGLIIERAALDQSVG
jgi:hypothetical protein